MSLLEFARGPALYWSLIIFSFGVILRWVGAVWIRRPTDLSKPRSTATTSGGIRTIFTRMWPHPEFTTVSRFHLVIGYVYHLGLAIVVFGFVPHILFIESITGMNWAGLSNDVVMISGAVTLAAMVVSLSRRMTHPVMRMISTWDDYLSWLVTALPLVTGLLLYSRLGGSYESMLAIHILSFDLLLVWFPFGKLMHAFTWIPSRFQLGAHFARRGVKA